MDAAPMTPTIPDLFHDFFFKQQLSELGQQKTGVMFLEEDNKMISSQSQLKDMQQALVSSLAPDVLDRGRKSLKEALQHSLNNE